MSLAVWKTSLLPSVDDILLPLDEEEIMDPRTDGQIDKDVPLFRQAINLPEEYGWLLDRFQFLPRMLGNWISPYYGTDILKINRDYNAIYPESAPVYDYACKVARLLLLEEIEDALLAQGKSPDTFFLQKLVKSTTSTNVLSERVMNELYHQENKALQSGAGMVPFSSSNDTSSCQYRIEGLRNSVIFCNKFAGKSPGTWYALTPDNKVNDVRSYFLWFSGGGACATIKSLANDEQGIDQIILGKVQIGTAFRDKNYFLKIHLEIQALLQTLSISLQPVYSELTDSLNKRLDDPSLSVYNPYKEMDPNVLKDLKRLVLLVDTFNRPQNPHETAPRIEAEWIDAINYRVFATHLGPLYFTEETQNYAVINDVRQKLLKVNVLDADAVADLLNRTTIYIDPDSRKMLNSLIAAINALPDVRDAREYVQTMPTIAKDLAKKYNMNPPVSSVNRFLDDEYATNVNALRNLQRQVNTFYKSCGKEALKLVFPAKLKAPIIDIVTIRQLKQYSDLRSLMPVNPGDYQFAKDLEQVSEQRKSLRRDAALLITDDYKKTWKAFEEQYAKWLDQAGRFQNMKRLENTNDFVRKYGEKLGLLKVRLRASVAKLREENAVIEEKAKTIARDNLIEFLNDQSEFNKANILTAFELVKNIKDIPENVLELIFEIGERALNSETVLSALKPEDWGLLSALFSGKNVSQEISELIARLDAAEYVEEQRLLQAKRQRLFEEQERQRKQKVAREKQLQAAESRRAEKEQQQKLLETQRKEIQKREEKQANARETLANSLFAREEQFTTKSILALQVQGGTIEAPHLFFKLLAILAEHNQLLYVSGKEEWQLLAAILRDPNVNHEEAVEDMLNKLETEENRIRLLEEQRKLALSDPNIKLSDGPLQNILSRYRPIKVPSGTDIITGSNFYNPDTSCPYDSLFTALFKIPGSWFENKIRMTKSVHATYNPQKCRSIVNGRPGWTHVDVLHEAILEDISFVQSPTVQKTLCKTRSFWKQCFETDSDLQDDPRTMLSSLFSFYNATDDLQEVLFENDGFLSDIAHKDKQMIMFRAHENSMGQTDYAGIISLELLEGEYTLLAAFFFKNAPPHWTAGIRDPRSKKWYEFDGLQSQAIELKGELPAEVTGGRGVGKGPLGWLYVRTTWLKNIEFKNAPPKTDAYNVLIQLLKEKHTRMAATGAIRLLKPKEQTTALMGLYKAGLISLPEYVGIIVEIIKTSTSQADIDRANQMIQILESAVINALKTITE